MNNLRFKKLKRAFLFIILFTFSQIGYSQLSDLHILPPLKQDANNQAIQQQTIYLSTPETASFNVKIYRGTNTTALATLSLSKATPKTYKPGNGDNNITLVTNANTGIKLSNSGLRFESENGEKFYVNYRGRSSSQAASITSKGRAALGKKFKWGGAPIEANHKTMSATLGIMATEDNTSVTISGYNTECIFRYTGTVAGITDNTINITLNKGQSYVLEAAKDATTANVDGWIGASITSDKDIAISNGMLNFGVNPGSASRDAGADQPVPEDKLGKDYVFVRGNGGASNEFVIIIGTQANTEIYVNNETTPFATIGIGEYAEIPSSKYSGTTSGKNMFVSSTKDVYAYQVLSGSSSIVTVSLNFVAPVNCLLPDTMDHISNIEDISGITASGGLFIIASTSTDKSNKELS
ncbi:IgGFc-binding protein [Polaribacter staleyi]|uniref:IgGFc-binding protein n=1 Tax=Polaribacter staleyi TaxID=2022337 RepID=UPI0031BB8709